MPGDQSSLMDPLSRQQSTAIDEAVALARQLGAAVWLRGGWAMDFALGRLTRRHSDIDMFVIDHHHRLVVAQLRASGWVLADRPTVDQQADLTRGELLLSLNPLAFDAEGLPVVAGGPWAGARWPGAMISDAEVGYLGGVRAVHIAIEAQIEIKQMTPEWQGLPRRAKDGRDLELLRSAARERP